MSSLWTSSFPPRPTFSVDQIPDLTGQVMIVTGGNAGIGKETVKALLEHNAKVYMAGRNMQRMEDAVSDIERDTGKRANILQVDLANLKSIKHAAEEFKTKETQLNVLFNNAGVMFPPIEGLTADGYDLQFGTNVLGHFYFTKLLLPLLLQTAKTTPSHQVRVVNTSSMGHMGVGGIDYDTLKDSPKRRSLRSYTLYFQSKFGNIVFSNELQKRYGDQGVISIALHPGNLNTDLQRHGSIIVRTLSAPFLYPAAMGALTQLYAGTMPEAAELGGKASRVLDPGREHH
ncbi:hypothetical protein NM688_g9192 [Phlebia brevispora]|uniref:Uncharacterized protein n=1 Tax=Phlebia brevispora TaxID=194682 RepID=A0ACC1RIF5_9APHY|nr:hypothetical protein NM688_g9192 [Phlebia brevispora]